MKAIFFSVIIALLNGSAACCLAAGSGLTWHFTGSPPWGATFKFDVLMGEGDRWDSTTEETPPLQPGKAIQRARQFVKKIALADGWSEWRVDHVKLLRSEDSEGHEEWLYVVYFYASKPHTLRSGPPDLSVPVRIDGTIPDFILTKP